MSSTLEGSNISPIPKYFNKEKTLRDSKIKSGITYDLSKFSEQTKDEIIKNLGGLMHPPPSHNPSSPELWGGVSTNDLIGFLKHDPIAFFEYRIEIGKNYLEWKKNDKNITPDDLKLAENKIKKYEKIIADLKKNMADKEAA